MSLHTIHFLRSINEESVVRLQNCLLSAVSREASSITLYLSSDGGSTSSGFTAYELIRSMPVPVTTHCIGNTESMAVILYLAGSTRLAVPQAKFKIHPMNWTFAGGQVDHSRLDEFGKSLDFDVDRYTAIFNERTQGADKSVNVRTHLRGNAKLLGAAAARSAGIVHQIADAVIPRDAIRWWVD